MSIIGKGTETYLYLNGIKPLKPIALSDGVILLPAACQPNPDDIIAKSKSEMDIGVACVFLEGSSRRQTGERQPVCRKIGPSPSRIGDEVRRNGIFTEDQ
jgi:hypothetical protein